MNAMTPKSGLFLGGCCITAIAAVGSVFELASGQPDLGNLNTAVILAVSIPATVLLFIAAVRNANSE
ncbi:MAG: hypothetical protein CLLPBCKN_005419 [Chroococcidiopsis cubana SAG 39.79]|jgi:hypothetical protein|uniref:Uncharacterized protein n=2 Tax=Chroococcidiopsis TaxID=54298 RepID=K9U479_CHRTP|nr:MULTISPECIES: hypothetical protein [Chroococcidiopsis]MBE9015689.1 hypothetical protein [Chroococcidiopsidales cyanobacterium LEGE 13417]AFY89887.1 hypothetical protein Chro_4495 [Chroococcidiopsis thermalis PCC 7203]MBD2308178.1 hypothetical protein [Chroococcidiopsis sp. [FACHB-1243]]MDZ4875999.1 hypothetical protein [Chroococcidiopsis cubana SAG 39.79]RUT12465.1 hypothetical protein DSM107010_22660 [Chroococcidiopsis cubana SAG 39.79]